MKKENWLVIIAGVLVGVAALVLTKLGNPANMGFCIACFERDIAGAVGMHSAAKVQYVRPEIIGLVLGAFIMALAGKEFRPQAGSSPATRVTRYSVSSPSLARKLAKTRRAVARSVGISFTG